MRARGADVHFLGHEGVRTRVAAEGFPFEPLTAGAQFDPTRQRPLLAMMGEIVRLTLDRSIGGQILDCARRLHVDAVVVDVVLTTALAEVTASEFPVVQFVHCFYRGIQDIARGPAGWALRARGLPPLGAERSGALQIVSASAELDPVRGRPPVRHTGVVWQGTPLPAAPQPVPRVLVSLSTNAFAGQHEMLQNILDAMAPLNLEATVTLDPPSTRPACGTGQRDGAQLADHDEVLATASLVVGHGGHSTTMRALSFGVPLVVMPANTLIDQKGIGRALETHGAGVLLRKHAGPQRIRAAIKRVLDDASYRAAANAIGATIRARDGAETAAEIITEFVAGTCSFPQRLPSPRA